jgi:hypothetical protein
MPLGPENYAGEPLSPEEQAHLNTLDVEGMKQFFHQRELRDGLRVKDSMNDSRLHEIDRTAAEAVAAEAKLRAVSPLTGAERDELARFRSQQPEIARTADGRFAREEQWSNANSGLDPIVDGLVEKHLKSLGVDIQDLREAVADKAAERNVVQTWAAATEEFKNGIGANWPGGDELREAVAYKIAELGLQDKPSAQSLYQAWKAVEADANQYAAVRDAKTPAELAEALGVTERQRERARNGSSY